MPPPPPPGATGIQLRDGRVNFKDGRVILAQDGDPCCCGPGGPPPPPRVRYVMARLCDPSIRLSHPEIPLVIFVRVPGDGTFDCPSPAAPVFKFRFVCYVALFPGLFVGCDDGDGGEPPGPGETCLPAGWIEGGCDGGSWASCEDDRCRKYILFGHPCASCPTSNSWCVWADARALSALGRACVVLAGQDSAGLLGCFEFTSGDPVFGIDEIPPGCVQADGLYGSCCECAAAVHGQASNCLDCVYIGWSHRGKSDSWKELLCPPQNPSGPGCCCGHDASYHVHEEWVTRQVHADGSSFYQRDEIDGDAPGVLVHRTWQGASAADAVEQPPFTIPMGVACGWFDVFGAVYGPIGLCGGGRQYTSQASGDCHNVSYSWQYSSAGSSGSESQEGMLTISGSGGGGPCSQGCGSGGLLGLMLVVGMETATVSGWSGEGGGGGGGGGCSGCGEEEEGGI